MAVCDQTLVKETHYPRPPRHVNRSARSRNLSTYTRKSFLFLQGVSSPFFARLARGLRAEGQWVKSVSFNMGDLIYASGSRVHFSGAQDQLEDFYFQLMRDERITDLVLFGDQRPVHQPAIKMARMRGVQVHVFEEGYFRPYWVTLERDGVNNLSRRPRDPRWYLDVGKHIPHYKNGNAFKLSFAQRALHDVLYHASGALNPVCFPHYQTHARYNAAVEYAGYLRQTLRLIKARAHDTNTVCQIARKQQPTFLLPLQLDSDAQIREHSPFTCMREVLDNVLRSFSLHAPTNTRLVIKNHPLTPGLVNYNRVSREIATHYAVADRVDFLESGCMPTLLSHVAGVITVNSTVGGSALLHGCPTLTLSDPIYAMPGLTHQSSLDDFWSAPQTPDATLFRRFRNTVIHTTQVNGGFYTPCGIEMAVNNSLEVLMAKTSRIELFL